MAWSSGRLNLGKGREFVGPRFDGIGIGKKARASVEKARDVFTKFTLHGQVKLSSYPRMDPLAGHGMVGVALLEGASPDCRQVYSGVSSTLQGAGGPCYENGGWRGVSRAGLTAVHDN